MGLIFSPTFAVGCCCQEQVTCAELIAQGRQLYLTDANGTHALYWSAVDAAWFCCYMWSNPHSLASNINNCPDVTANAACAYRFTCFTGPDMNAPVLAQRWQRVSVCKDLHTTPPTFKYNTSICVGTNDEFLVHNSQATAAKVAWDPATSLGEFTVPIYPDGVDATTITNHSYTPFPGTILISP